MATNLQERKIELIQELYVIGDATLLEKIADLKEQNSSDWWDKISVAETNQLNIGPLSPVI